MAETFDFKKAQKNLYAPGPEPELIQVPEMLFLAVDGRGNPNTAQAYQEAIEVLYGLAYTIKMAKKGDAQPEGYFDFVVPPLEGFWWTQEGGFDATRPGEKDRLLWTAVLHQPEFVTQAVLDAAQAKLKAKKPELNTGAARLWRFCEGLCVQILHQGPFDAEPETMARMEPFLQKEGCRIDFSDDRKHHEIYLSDFRKTAPDKLKTVIRHPVKRA